MAASRLAFSLAIDSAQDLLAESALNFGTSWNGICATTRRTIYSVTLAVDGMAEDSRERKRERHQSPRRLACGERRKQRDRALQQRKLQRGTAADRDSTPQANDVTHPTGQGKQIREQDLAGLKYFDKLAPLLQRMHDDSCQRDTAGNRKLHDDQYCLLILLYLFDPIVMSLRGIQQASESGVDRDGISRNATNLPGTAAEPWSVPDEVIALWTGRQPTLRTYEMICLYFIGLASEDELMQHLAKLKPQAA